MKLQKLLIASHNSGKLQEISELLQPYVQEVCLASDLKLPEPEETESTFVGNARLKAQAAWRATGLTCLADDSGFCVTALDGRPGVHSARWAGPEKDFTQAMQRVWQSWQEQQTFDRSAAFHCTLALITAKGQEHVFSAETEGNLCWPPRGHKGFGYDPMFIPTGAEQTFAEMTTVEKHSYSHRRRAFDQLLVWLSHQP